MSIREGGNGGLFVEQREALANPSSANLAGDLTNGVVQPTYNTLLTASITTLLASSYLHIDFYVSCFTLGGGASNKAPTVRFRLNGVLLPPSRACTENEFPARIMTMNFLRRIVVSAGVQTVIAEWAYFGVAGASLQCLAGTLPDLFGAQLILEEQR